jgi:ribosomal protein S18 acetylase RimI-like enzyme
MLKEHVKYEKMESKFRLSKKNLYKHLFEYIYPWFCLVVEDLRDQKLKGMLLYSLNFTNRSFYLKPKVYIDRIYIRSEYRHAGLGTILIRTLKENLHSEGINTIELWCMKSNNIAYNFYKKIGFKEISAYILQLKYRKRREINSY